MAAETKMVFSREVVVSASLDDKNGILLLSFRGSHAFVPGIGRGRHNQIFDDLCRKASSAAGNGSDPLSLETEDLVGMRITFVGVFREDTMTGGAWEITKVHLLEKGGLVTAGANVEEGVCLNLCIDSGLCTAFSEYMYALDVAALCGSGSCRYFRPIGSLCEGCRFGMSVLADDEYCCAENTEVVSKLRICCTEEYDLPDGYRYTFWKKKGRRDCRHISLKKVIEFYGSNWIAEKSNRKEI